MKPTRILLADPHPVVQEGLRSCLSAQGADWEICATAATGLDAVAKAVALAPDIVVMDYRLPDFDGLAAAAEIRQRAPRVEVLLFSEADSHFILQRIFHSRVRGCMLKSEALDELIPALETVRRGHRFRSRALTDLCETLTASAGAAPRLTRREMEVLRLIAEGNPTKEIARHLGVSRRTIESHRTHLFCKLKCHCVTELVCYAIYHGIVELRRPGAGKTSALPSGPEAGRTSAT